MSSLSVRLPLERSPIDGFEMIKSVKGMVKQNFKMLLLTEPGERVMEPNFGVGIKKFLFENFNQSTFAKIERRILDQTGIYLPAVKIQSVSFLEDELDLNRLNIRIEYALPNLNIRDLLQFTI